MPKTVRPGVLQRDEAHERVAVRAFAADLVGVDAGGLVAVVPVGDQKLGVGQLGGERLVDGGVGDPPDAVDRAVGVGDLAPGSVVSWGSMWRQASPG